MFSLSLVLAPVFDMAIGIVVFIFGSLGPLVLFVPAFVIEGFILRYAEATESPFTASFVMNLVTTILGVPMGYLFTLVAFGGTSFITGESSTSVMQYGSYLFLSIFLTLVLSWLFSVLVEGAILIWGYQMPKREGLLASITVNIASYALWLLLLMVLYGMNWN